MDDLISRQAAINAVEFGIKYVKVISEETTLLREINAELEKASDRIKQLPSTQPERIKGHWIKISPANIYECSECGKSVMTNDICAYDFCHGCGAEMEVTT